MDKFKRILGRIGIRSWGEFWLALFFIWVFILPAFWAATLLLIFIIPESWTVHSYLVWILDTTLPGYDWDEEVPPAGYGIN